MVPAGLDHVVIPYNSGGQVYWACCCSAPGIEHGIREVEGIGNEDFYGHTSGS